MGVGSRYQATGLTASFRAVLRPDISVGDVDRILKEIMSVHGVKSALIGHSGKNIPEIRIDGASHRIQNEVRKIAGVVGIKLRL